MIFSGSGGLSLAGAVAGQLELQLGKRDLERFPDGECHVRVLESVRGQDVYFVVSTGPPVEANLVELLLLSDACRRAGAARLTAVIPYFGYARQDRRASGRESVGARLIADLLEAGGLDRVVTIDLHSPALEGFFSLPIEHLTAVPLLAEALGHSGVGANGVVVAPDLGAARLADRYAKLLELPVAIVHKTRISGREVAVHGVSGDVEGRQPLIVDDMISTGGTIEAAARSSRRGLAACRRRRGHARPVRGGRRGTPGRGQPAACDRDRYRDRAAGASPAARGRERRADPGESRSTPARGPIARRTRCRRLRPKGATMINVETEKREERLVRVATGRVTLEGNLVVPEGAAGVVLFAHGSGSSRRSPRNRSVARDLQERGLATLLIDLLTADEEAIDRETAHLRFDIDLLAERLAGATDWLLAQPETRHLRIGYFGASTGAAAALVAAALRPRSIGAVVSRGGRPDLAGDALPRVEAPTLLIVGGDDLEVPVEPRRLRPALLREEARDRAARFAPLRGAGNPGGRGAPGRRLVRQTPGPGGAGEWSLVRARRPRGLLGALLVLAVVSQPLIGFAAQPAVARAFPPTDDGWPRGSSAIRLLEKVIAIGEGGGRDSAVDAQPLQDRRDEGADRHRRK